MESNSLLLCRDPRPWLNVQSEKNSRQAQAGRHGQKAKAWQRSIIAGVLPSGYATQKMTTSEVASYYYNIRDAGEAKR
jgi:hypothetical protein